MNDPLAIVSSNCTTCVCNSCFSYVWVVMKNLAILGSTGSIGSSTLSVLKNNHEVFNVSLLSAKSNWEKIFNQCMVFKPKYVHLEDQESSKKLKEKLYQENLSTSLIDKKDFLKLISSNEVDVVVAGIVGTIVVALYLPMFSLIKNM